MFDNIYSGRRVLVTGHTGFKGSWLAAWLVRLGAEVTGYALEPLPGPSHWRLLELPAESVTGDILDGDHFCRTLDKCRPEIVFHLAAQPLVRLSYREPLETLRVNVMGTANVFELCRNRPELRAVVAVTSDKCYENPECGRPFRESDPLGGYDPYSASKGCAELVAASYRRSFYRNGGSLAATARAGNVIGGGDWAEDRLVPDLVRAAVAAEIEEIRSPDAIRPWQHVLESLSGYLLLGQKLLQGRADCAEAWNFGPPVTESVTVEAAAAALGRTWPAIRFRPNPPPDAPHEAGVLRLDCSKAAERLGWHCVWNSAVCFERTAAWYRDYYTEGRINTAADLECYLKDAAAGGLPWIG
jgi:CDP-glucose 4,6-dehydratase